MSDPVDVIASRQAGYENFKNYAALTFLVASPILIALPPRKLDPMAVFLGSAFCISANHVTREKTGRSIVDRIDARIRSRPAILRELPSERAEEVQAQLRAARDAQIREGGTLGEELEKLKARQKNDQGVASRVWMGGESEGWMERRLKEEQKALEEGKGYGDLIQEYIMEVWNGGRKAEDESEKDE
ncbi:hypothetical protein N7492_001627 [Penicillium capsulatum]|uniref:Rhomboid family membrane protein n=1 Tax=Penicillium capsulatum TaxID=69766 RepID=A0A9W9IV13_9EURO|nr:hypothetical protein N7492_001627 [Penicillium capsulatum]KAJ6129320.1 hypothetical protein N7512_002100 [Penicillium capsulatum]